MKIFFCFLLLLINVNSFADTNENSTNNEDIAKKKIIQSLKKNLPDLQVDQVNSIDVTRLYEVVSGHKVFYVDQDGKYILLGNLVDLSTKKSITQNRVEELSVFTWNRLPLNIALRQKIGNGRNKIAVFTDPDCPFCQNLEKDTISKLHNVTVYYFLYPLSIHADAETDSKKILCSEIPEATFLSWMKDGTTLPKKINCKNSEVLVQMKYVAERLVKIEATPTILLEDGTIIPGLAPADYLDKLIAEAGYKMHGNESSSTTLTKAQESIGK